MIRTCLAAGVVAAAILASCAPGRPPNGLVWTLSLGPFPADLLQARRLDDPILLNTECTVTVNDGTNGALVRPTLNGRLNDPGSSLSFGTTGGYATCMPPRLRATPSLAVSQMSVVTTGAALVVGVDAGLQGTITLSDGRQFTIDAQRLSRLRVTAGDPDDIGAGLSGEFEFVARDASGSELVLVRNSSFAIYNAR
ncbi:MAG: hypothetical protein JNK67_14930 [Alphaproteobacteria bacterium]|nr:hypothetical protein [Alphaproteobacteria bacterium]